MPLKVGDNTISTDQKSIAIFKMTLLNEHTNYNLFPQTITAKSADVENGIKTYTFEFGNAEKELGNRGSLFIGSVALTPGEYYLTTLSGRTSLGMATILPVRGIFEQDLGMRFKINSNEIIYLGHIKVRLVKKTSYSEERAGSIMPILDQLATGISDGTFKFEIVDDFVEDEKYFKSTFPALSNRTIVKSLLQ